uniref:Opticin n=1 Tax=Varanus komodoensis TaxID=61221 RepID=A0A8D2L0E8_VARKO
MPASSDGSCKLKHLEGPMWPILALKLLPLITVVIPLYYEHMKHGNCRHQKTVICLGLLLPSSCTVLSPLYVSLPLLSPDLPTCLICVCISNSVYCDDTDLEHIPPLPLETTYFYARFNRISRIQANDFLGLAKLKRIDLTSNFLSWVDEDSFQLLPALEELVLTENMLTSLPELPSAIVQLDAQFNMLQSAGIRPDAFRDLKNLQFLHLSDNKLDNIPVPLPEGLRSLHLQNNNIQTMQGDTFCDSEDPSHIRRALEDIRLDGNPINLSLFPSAYFCLPRLPTGHFY